MSCHAHCVALALPVWNCPSLGQVPTQTCVNPAAKPLAVSQAPAKPVPPESPPSLPPRPIPVIMDRGPVGNGAVAEVLESCDPLERWAKRRAKK